MRAKAGSILVPATSAANGSPCVKKSKVRADCRGFVRICAVGRKPRSGFPARCLLTRQALRRNPPAQFEMRNIHRGSVAHRGIVAGE